MRARLGVAAAAAVFSTLLLSPVARAGDMPGTPGYVLDLPDTVGIGQNFDTCLQAPGNSLVILFIGSGPGPVQTRYGPIHVSFPFLAMWTFFMPVDGQVCLPHLVECDPTVVGLTAWFQFAAFGPAPGQVGLSNSQAMTATDSGACEVKAGDFVTYTMGGWGAKCSGSNPGCLRDEHFGHAFPDGLLLGDQDGIDGDGHYALLLTSSLAVQDFLPEGTTSQAFTQDDVDVANGTGGNISGQLCAARLSVAFDDAGCMDGLKGQTLHRLGDMLFAAGVHAKILGRPVRSMLDLADRMLADQVPMPYDIDNDGIGDLAITDVASALEVVNCNFDNGTVNMGNLRLP